MVRGRRLPRLTRTAGALTLGLLLAVPLAEPVQAAGLATRTFSTSFADTCSVIGRSYQVPAVVTGRLPQAVPRGGSFRLQGLVFSATIPVGLSARAYDLGARSARLTLEQVHARGVGVGPAVQDVVRSDVVIDGLVVRRGRPIPFSTEQSGPLAAAFTAGPRAGTGRLEAGTVGATITLLRADGSVLAQDEPISCSRPTPAVVVTTVRIT